MAYYARARSSPLATPLFAVYVAVGIIIANSHGYFRHLTDIKSFISAVLAVILWPLISWGTSTCTSGSPSPGTSPR